MKVLGPQPAKAVRKSKRKHFFSCSVHRVKEDSLLSFIQSLILAQDECWRRG